jgi:hypothetical protein
MWTEDSVSTEPPKVNADAPAGRNEARRDSVGGANPADARRTEPRKEPDDRTPEEAGYGYGV